VVLGAKKRVIVHTTPGSGSQTIEGILVRKRPEFVLELADLHTSPEDKVQVKGRVHILRESIAFYQELR
jgi:hypothetical protein